MPRHGDNLAVRWQAGTPRAFLDFTPVHIGTVLELELARGVWVPCRIAGTLRLPFAQLALGGPWEGRADAFPVNVEFPLPSSARLRWPTSTVRVDPDPELQSRCAWCSNPARHQVAAVARPGQRADHWHLACDEHARAFWTGRVAKP